MTTFSAFMLAVGVVWTGRCYLFERRLLARVRDLEKRNPR